jgi:hypothetical protein
MRRRNFLELGSGAAIGAPGACAAGEPGAHDADAVAGEPAAAGTVAGWNRLALQAIGTLQPDRSTAARSLAVLHTCMYNAWAAYDDDARQTAHGVAVRLPRAERSAASKASAMSHAAWLALCGQFPALRASFDAHMRALGLDPAVPNGQLTPAGIGRTQATAMLDACRENDSDGTGSIPDPGHWFRLAQSVSERECYDDDQDVCLFFALANALADAATSSADAGQACGAAAGEVLRRFTGSAMQGATAGQESGREAGARAFDKARRYWDGKL